MGKLNAQAGSKLAKFAGQEAEKKVSTGESSSKTGIMQSTSSKKQGIARTFRFASDDIMNLKEITTKVNAETRSTVSETKIIRALIQLGTKAETSRIIKSLAEII